MNVKTFVGKRTAAIVLMVIVALGLAACAPPAPSGGGPGDAFTSSLLQSLNADRTHNGLPALSWNATLANSANSWAHQMANAGSLYHQNLSALIYSPTYAGFHALGENILVGPGSMSAPSLETAWMNSPPHRANITSGGFNVVGIGYYRGPDGRIWAAQEFGGI
jgi:uncharacterized protein YkwD